MFLHMGLANGVLLRTEVRLMPVHAVLLCAEQFVYGPHEGTGPPCTAPEPSGLEPQQRLQVDRRSSAFSGTTPLGPRSKIRYPNAWPAVGD